MKALCVSIHDVAPATWPLCRELAQALRGTAKLPLTWLVVPRFHGDDSRSPEMERALERGLADGDELVLHGFTHADPTPAASGLRQRFLRRIYTQSEGEFSALGEDEARARIAAGIAWFRERGWPLHGFVAPAWLLGQGAWAALRDAPFSYTTTFPRFYALPGGASLYSPSLVYTARNRAGRLFSPPAASLLALALDASPLVRFSLHPRDAQHPRLVRHALRLIGRMAREREPLTKFAFSQRYFAPQPGAARADTLLAR